MIKYKTWPHRFLTPSIPYVSLPVDAVRNEATMEQIKPELERIDKTAEGGIDGYLNRLLSRLA